MQFQDAGLQEQLCEWHQQWATMGAETQDSHLLWMFHADRTVAGAEITLPHGQKKRRRVSRASGEEVSDDRISTSSVDSWSSRRSCAEDRVATESEKSAESRIPTSPVESSECSSMVDLASSMDESQPRRRRHKYNNGKTRRSRWAIHFMGHTVCTKAAMTLMRVGTERLARVMDGRPDGRRDRPHVPGKMTTSVWRFLWRLYQSVAEGMPDKFNFASQDAQTMIVAVAGPGRTLGTRSEIRPEHLDFDDQVGGGHEEEVRAIAAHAMRIDSVRNPTDAALVGPGMFTGPLRFLPPGKRVHLYWEYTVWAQGSGMPVASFNTFLRAFAQSHQCLRIRKVGEHAVCHTCAIFKKRLSKARFPKERQAILEEYSGHILKQWMDRQVYGNAMTVSLECRRMLEMGQFFSNMAVSVSQVCLIVDGMDQAKFRVPRIFCKTKGLDKLVRPALHVQGAWAHGFGYHLAVMDADMRHDTNNNVEVISRMLEQIHETYGGLPLGLHLQQDNTCRECKNQKILKWACKLVALGVFQWVSLNYLITGHTHENLDATFGQLTVKLSAHEFDDDQDVVDLLMKLVGVLGIDKVSQRASLAYKVDEAASWETWWDDITVNYSQLTGPRAPHVFKVCLRQDLGKLNDSGERDTQADALPGNPPPSGGDIVVVVREHMHSPIVHQVFTAWPASHCGAHLQALPQADSLHPRRPMAAIDRQKIARLATQLCLAQTISGKARDYLVDWAMGTRRRQPRPASYRFLEHRARDRVSQRPLMEQHAQRPAIHRVQVRGVMIPAAAPPGPLARPALADAGSDDDALGNNALVLLPG